MSGMVMLPVVTTSDTGLPDSVPYRALAMTHILAGPPRIRPAMEAASLAPGFAEVTMRADNDIVVEGDVAAQVAKLLDMLEDLDDVQNVYSNADQGALA